MSERIMLIGLPETCKEEPLGFCKSENRNRSLSHIDSIKSFDDLIWRLATNFTNSKEESEAAANEIFADIQNYSVRRKATESAEGQLTSLIALRTLIKRLH